MYICMRGGTFLFACQVLPSLSLPFSPTKIPRPRHTNLRCHLHSSCAGEFRFLRWHGVAVLVESCRNVKNIFTRFVVCPLPWRWLGSHDSCLGTGWWSQNESDPVWPTYWRHGSTRSGMFEKSKREQHFSFFENFCRSKEAKMFHLKRNSLWVSKKLYSDFWNVTVWDWITSPKIETTERISQS